MENSYTKFNHEQPYVYDLQGYGHCLSDLSYGEDPLQKLDLYLPSIKKKAYPTVIYIHGGAFCQGDKTHHLNMMLQSLKKGYAVAAINYRLAPQHHYPDFIYDVCEGIRYLKAHKEYHLDQNQFILWGDTHGGYLAVLIGLCGHLISYQSAYFEESLKVKGVISLSAPLDLKDFHLLQRSGYGHYSHGENDLMAFKKEGLALLNLLDTLNPLNYIAKTDTSFVFLHGDKDQKIPLKYTITMAQALIEQKVHVIVDIIKNGEHAIDYYDQDQYYPLFMNYLDTILTHEGF